MRMGLHEEARRSLAWALQCDPGEIELPTTLVEEERTRWRELFRYPRSWSRRGCQTSSAAAGRAS
jgi:putative MFS transporter